MIGAVGTATIWIGYKVTQSNILGCSILQNASDFIKWELFFTIQGPLNIFNRYIYFVKCVWELSFLKYIWEFKIDMV